MKDDIVVLDGAGDKKRPIEERCAENRSGCFFFFGFLDMYHVDHRFYRRPWRISVLMLLKEKLPNWKEKNKNLKALRKYGGR